MDFQHRPTTPSAIERRRNMWQVYLHEYRFNLSDNSVTETKISDTAVEFPRVHPSLLGRRSQFAYCATQTSNPPPCGLT
jgi:carotenoid cleavage dioxygenase-like enzyme